MALNAAHRRALLILVAAIAVGVWLGVSRPGNERSVTALAAIGLVVGGSLTLWPFIDAKTEWHRANRRRQSIISGSLIGLGIAQLIPSVWIRLVIAMTSLLITIMAVSKKPKQLFGVR